MKGRLGVGVGVGSAVLLFAGTAFGLGAPALATDHRLTAWTSDHER